MTLVKVVPGGLHLVLVKVVSLSFLVASATRTFVLPTRAGDLVQEEKHGSATRVKDR